MTDYELFLAIWLTAATAISLALAAIAAAQARKKGRRPWLWGALGLLFGILALIALSRKPSTSASRR